MVVSISDFYRSSHLFHTRIQIPCHQNIPLWTLSKSRQQEEEEKRRCSVEAHSPQAAFSCCDRHWPPYPLLPWTDKSESSILRANKHKSEACDHAHLNLNWNWSLGRLLPREARETLSLMMLTSSTNANSLNIASTSSSVMRFGTWPTNSFTLSSLLDLLSSFTSAINDSHNHHQSLSLSLWFSPSNTLSCFSSSATLLSPKPWRVASKIWAPVPLRVVWFGLDWSGRREIATAIAIGIANANLDLP